MSLALDSRGRAPLVTNYCEAYMALNPNYMAAFNAQSRDNAQTMTFTIEDGILTLRLTRVSGEAVTATSRRPGQPQD